ncbi:MAG: four helix bundle protein [Bacteroidota bacterium]
MESDKEKFKKEFKRRLYNWTLRLIEFVDKLPNDNPSRRLGDQLLRSGTSIIANYIEGQSASSKKDFINYFTTSLKSANESKLWISLLKDTGRAKNQDADQLLDELNEIANIFGSSILTLKKRR